MVGSGWRTITRSLKRQGMYLLPVHPGCIARADPDLEKADYAADSIPDGDRLSPTQVCLTRKSGGELRRRDLLSFPSPRGGWR